MEQQPRNHKEEEELETLRAELSGIESELRSLREQQAKARKAKEAAVRSANTHPDDDDSYAAAEAASDMLKELEQQLEHLTSDQVDLLKELGDSEAGRRPHFDQTGAGGWRDVARHLNIERGEFRADASLAALMQPMVAFDGQVGVGSSRLPALKAPFVQQPIDRRYVYPVFPRESLDAGVLAVVEFRQDAASGTVSGNVMRDPVSVEPKAELDIGITAASEDVEQFAITIDDVPQILFSSEPALHSFLRTRMQRVLDLAIDTHVLDQIQAASPPSGASGTGLITQVRNAVAASRTLGANPSVLAVSPDAAADLDLTTTGTDDAYLFATRGTGSASPLWGLQIVESPSVTDPILLDPGLVGALWAGAGTITIDPYTGLKTNTVRLRLEIEALFHVRAIAGAYVIA